MMKKSILPGAAMVLFFLTGGIQRPSLAQERETRPQEGRAATAPTPPPKEEWSVTEHSVRIGGQVVPYKAAAGTTLLKDEKGEPTGLLYSIAYTRSDVKDPGTRPLAFFATEFTMQHLGLPAELQNNIRLSYYAAGHMMYLHDESRVKLHDNIAAFIDRAAPQPGK